MQSNHPGLTVIMFTARCSPRNIHSNAPNLLASDDTQRLPGGDRWAGAMAAAELGYSSWDTELIQWTK